MAVLPKRFTPGDIFGIPLPDGSMGVGQVLGREREALDSVGCAFYASKVGASKEVSLPAPIAVLLVTPDQLNKGTWPVLEQAAIHVPPQQRPYEQFRDAAWVGVTIVGSRNVAEFLAAYHGLRPWDDWHDPAYLDKLLLPGVHRPDHVVFSKKGW